MAKESLIHVKLNPEELIQSKKEILSAQADLIKVLQALKEYHAIRSKELKLKSILHGKLKETKLKIKKLEQTLPKIEFPKDLKEKELSEELMEIKPKSKRDGLSIQLEEIQKKLKELER